MKYTGHHIMDENFIYYWLFVTFLIPVGAEILHEEEKKKLYYFHLSKVFIQLHSSQSQSFIYLDPKNSMAKLTHLSILGGEGWAYNSPHLSLLSKHLSKITNLCKHYIWQKYSIFRYSISGARIWQYVKEILYLLWHVNTN